MQIEEDYLNAAMMTGEKPITCAGISGQVIGEES